jgi:hypothetical protein
MKQTDKAMEQTEGKFGGVAEIICHRSAMPV